jgi:hypothetical protein
MLYLFRMLSANADDLKYLANGISNHISISKLNLFENNIGLNAYYQKYLADGITNNTYQLVILK